MCALARSSIIGLAALLVVLAACGGGTGVPALVGETALPTVSPSPTSAAAEHTPVAGETSACSAQPVPDESPVAFRGRVMGEPAEVFLYAKVPVRIEEARLSATPVAWQYAYVPGEVVEVVVWGEDLPEVAANDCVLVAGDVSGWACGAACDAVGFVARDFQVAR